MPETPAQQLGDTSWFVHDRFGLFIHWGLYALPARHEWVKHREEIADSKYDVYFKYFDPDLYDPTAWARAAKAAGMKYFVITTKHHEGFCLWDSDLTDYKVTNTPYGKDLIGPMVEAFRAEGLKVGFYHSLLDWHHPDFPIDGLHSQRNDKALREKEKNRDVRKYADYLLGQSAELMDRYDPDIMWYDFSYSGHADGGKGKDDWQSERIIKMLREKKPGLIINDRLEIPQDIRTPEQYQPREAVSVDGKPVIWEACQTLNGSWGYDRDNLDWKPVDMLVRMLVDGVSKGGNLLLNVGPTGRGEFDARAMAALTGMGEWTKRHGRSIYGCGPERVQGAGRLPLHAERQPALPAYLHLAAQARLPGRAEGQGRVCTASQRRQRSVHPREGARAGRRRRHTRAPASDPETGRVRARR